MGGSFSSKKSITDLYSQISSDNLSKDIEKLLFINTDNKIQLDKFLQQNGLKLEKHQLPKRGWKFWKTEGPTLIELGDKNIPDSKDRHKFQVYSLKIANHNANKYKEIIKQIKNLNKEDLNNYLKQDNKINEDFLIHIFDKTTDEETIMEVLERYGLTSNLSLDELKNIIKQITFASQLREGGGKRKVRKHKGIVQTGGNCGRLKKGYKYTGKRTKTGLPIITKT